jgi:peroxiredoxin
LLLASCLFLLAPNLAHAKQAKHSEILNKSGKAEVGKPAPWFSGWTLNDKVFNLKKAFRDPATQRVALVFWATWCKPCKVGMAKLKKNKARLHKAGVRVMLMNFKEEKDAVSRFILKHPKNFPVMLDPYGRTEKSYLVSGKAKLCLPRTVIVGRNGKVLRIIGEEGNDYVEQIIR